ncbi:MAG: hypothetical protein GY801_10775 [bacterium]|nr:hypothetical protein [bacterium]
MSIDTKAKLAIGDFSRHGTTRIAKPEPAWDHDMSPTGKLVPEGLFEPGHDRRRFTMACPSKPVI